MKKINAEQLLIKVGKRLRKLRIQKKQSILDASLEMEINQNYLNDIELGRKNFSMKILIKMANYYGVSLEDLLK